MSEAAFNKLLKRLRVLARRNITCNANGTVIRGALDPEIELLRLQASELHNKVLDGQRLKRHERTFVQHCTAVIQDNLQIVLALEAEAI